MKKNIVLGVVLLFGLMFSSQAYAQSQEQLDAFNAKVEALSTYSFAIVVYNDAVNRHADAALAKANCEALYQAWKDANNNERNLGWEADMLLASIDITLGNSSISDGNYVANYADDDVDDGDDDYAIEFYLSAKNHYDDANEKYTEAEAYYQGAFMHFDGATSAYEQIIVDISNDFGPPT